VFFLQRSDSNGWATGWTSSLQKNWVLVYCWWWLDWSFARLSGPVVTTTSIVLSSNKSQNLDILVLADPGSPGKMAAVTESSSCLLVFTSLMEIRYTSVNIYLWQWRRLFLIPFICLLALSLCDHDHAHLFVYVQDNSKDCGWIWARISELIDFGPLHPAKPIFLPLMYAPRLRNDLYCVEWDVKLYYTIPYLMYAVPVWCRASTFGVITELRMGSFSELTATLT